MIFSFYSLGFIFLFVYSIPNYIDLIDLSSSTFFPFREYKYRDENYYYNHRLRIYAYSAPYTLCDNNNEEHYCRYYKLIGTSNYKGINFTDHVMIYIDSINMIYSGNLPPIIIEKDGDVTLNISGTSTLADSSSNELNATIYLSEGAKLNIIGNGTLNIFANKKMAIKGDNSSHLLIKGVNINIFSEENNESMIYVDGNFAFKDGVLNYKSMYGEKYDINCKNNGGASKELFNLESNFGNIIQVKDSIYIQSGILNLKAGKGIALKAGKNIYLGEMNENNTKLNIKIESLGEGIESNTLIIFSGTISILTEGVGIKILQDSLSSNFKIYNGDINVNSNENAIQSYGNIYVMGGKLVLFGASEGNYEPIIDEGVMFILKGAILIGGSNLNSGFIVNNTQFSIEYKRKINAGTYIKVFNKENIFDFLEMPKSIEYIYSSYPNNYTIEFIDKEELNNIRTLIVSETNEDIDLIDTSISQKNEGYNRTESAVINSNGQNNEKENISNLLKSSIILILILNIIIY